MRAVGTNALVRLLVRDNEEQARAAERFVAGGASVSHLVLTGTVWVLDAVYERTARQIGDAIDTLLSHEALAVQDADTVTAALDTSQERSAVYFSECMILEIARKAGHTPLGTFDRKLSMLDGAVRLK